MKAGSTALLILINAASAIAQDAQRALTVCEVFAKLQEYRNQRITVRGVWLSHYHGSGLVGENCPDLKTAVYTWPGSTPLLVLPAGSSLVENPTVPKPTVKVAPFPSESELKSYGPGASLLATVVGRLETRIQFEMVAVPGGRKVPNGYGHLNAAPAQLVYEEIRDIVVVKPK